MKSAKTTESLYTVWYNYLISGNIYKGSEIWMRESDLKSSMYRSPIYYKEAMETTKILVKRGMDKEMVVLLFLGILFSQWKEWNSTICSKIVPNAQWNEQKGKCCKFFFWYKEILMQNIKQIGEQVFAFILTDELCSASCHGRSEDTLWY